MSILEDVIRVREDRTLLAEASLEVRALANHAAEIIWEDLTDRRGIKWELRQCNPLTQFEIKKTMARAVVLAIKQASNGEDGEVTG